MNKIDELLNDPDRDKSSGLDDLQLDYRLRASLRDNLEQIGIDTTNRDQMRGVLGGVIVVAQVHNIMGTLEPKHIGEMIKNTMAVHG